MAGAMHKTLAYLGLAQTERADDQYAYDDEYDDYGSEAGSHEEVASVRELRPVSSHDVVASNRVGGLSRITTIHPRTYNEAKTIGENFRQGIPVIMNLSEMTDADAKRLVDFAAGLVFGLRGDIERVTSKVFLLSPESVEVNAEESAPSTSRGVFNQS